MSQSRFRIQNPEKLFTKILRLLPSKVAKKCYITCYTCYIIIRFTVPLGIRIQSLWTNSINSSEHDSITVRISYKKPKAINLKGVFSIR